MNSTSEASKISKMHRHSVGCLGQDQFESSQLLNRLKQCDRKYCLKAQDFPPVCPPAGFNGINGKLSPVSPLYVIFKIHGFRFMFYRSKPKNRKIHQKNSPQVPENHDQPLDQPLDQPMMINHWINHWNQRRFQPLDNHRLLSAPESWSWVRSHRGADVFEGRATFGDGKIPKIRDPELIEQQNTYLYFNTKIDNINIYIYYK